MSFPVLEILIQEYLNGFSVARCPNLSTSPNDSSTARNPNPWTNQTGFPVLESPPQTNLKTIPSDSCARECSSKSVILSWLIQERLEGGKKEEENRDSNEKQNKLGVFHQGAEGSKELLCFHEI